MIENDEVCEELTGFSRGNLMRLYYVMPDYGFFDIGLDITAASIMKSISEKSYEVTHN